MRISKHRIINLDRYIGGLPAGGKFRIIAALDEAVPDILSRLGLGPSPGKGETILPRAVGPVSRFNAKGRWLARRDLPKEPRYIRTVVWRWQQWSGRGRTEEHEGFKDIFRDCYPLELIPPPSLELTYVEAGGRRLMISEELTNDAASAEHIKHGLNLFLEIFGFCELAEASLARIAPASVKRVNWQMLPQGRYPWEKLKDHIDAAVGKRGDDTRRVIWDRQETLKSYGPDEIFVGAGGFDEYLAYVFKARGIVVLESVRRDNAIYVFGQDWKKVSQLSKADVLGNRYHRARIIHVQGWKAKLAQLMNKSRAA